jgi:SbmA/BacA-like family
MSKSFSDELTHATCILLLHIANDGLITIVHVDVLDAHKLLPAVTPAAKDLNLGGISSHQPGRSRSEYTEQVALLNGEAAERNMIGQRFGALIANYLALVYRSMRVTAFTHTFGQISPIIPYIFTAPFYFAREIELGVMTQTAGAFGHVASALTFFVNYYTYLAGFKSVVDRLNSFDIAIDQAEALSNAGPARVDHRAVHTPVQNSEGPFADKPRSQQYLSTGRSKLWPLKVMSWGRNWPILSTKSLINLASGRSPTCGAPSASMRQPSGWRLATRRISLFI